MSGINGTQLVRYDAMVNAITACHSVDEVKDLKDKALALEIYARQSQNIEAERKATEVRLRAERRTGELLKELRRAEAPNPSGKNQHAVTRKGCAQPDSEYASALGRTGLSPRTAQRYQELASVPAEKFESHLRDTDTKPTTSGILRAANGSPRMDDGSLWVWGRLRDFERDGYLTRDAAKLFSGMTETMQADVRRVLPALLDWLTELQEAAE